MKQPDTTPPNSENAKGMQKQKPADKAGANRFSSVYWESRAFRPTYTRDGERTQVSQYFVQIAHGGRRHAVALATNNLAEAGRRGVKLFKTLKQDGWDAALRLFRPDAESIDRALTVGRYLSLVDEYTPLPKRTFANYAYALRRIAGDIAGAKLAKDANRFDPRGKWRSSPDEVPLGKITPVAVEDWRNRFLKERRGDQLAEQRAIRSTNSYIRNARALFSRRILEAMRKHQVTLPDPLPLSGVRLGKAGSTRYRSQIDAGTLLQAARLEFAETDPDAYAVALLALGAGLRRSEIDALQWQQVMPEKGIIRVMTTAQSGVKTDESEGDIYVDPGLFSELEKTRRSGRTLFVIEPDREHRKTAAAQYYRADRTFDRVLSWLRAKQGLSVSKPIHTLRKEFGSLVTDSGDIYQAQRQLRHAQISTTEQYYADARKRATVAVGSLLSPKVEEVSNG